MPVLERESQLLGKEAIAERQIFPVDAKGMDAFASKTIAETAIPQVFQDGFKEKPVVEQKNIIFSDVLAEGSFFMKVPGRENEWVVTQSGAPLPDDKTYDIGKPLEMIAKHAPKAGEKAKAIMENGRRPDKPLPTEGVVSLEQAKDTFALFTQVMTKPETNKSRGKDVVTTTSAGLPWDRQTSLSDAMRNMVRHMAGDENAMIIWFGPYDAIAVANGVSPEEMYDRFLEAPAVAYEKDERLAHLAPATRALQEERKVTEGRNKKRYLDGYYENFDATPEVTLERAFREGEVNTTYSWKMDRRGNTYAAITPDGDEMPFIDLARTDDINTENKIRFINDLLLKDTAASLSIAMASAPKTATCCGFSSNTQQEALKSLSLHQLRAVMSGFATVDTSLFPFALGKDTDKYVCKKCRRMDACVCSDDETAAGSEA